MSVTIKDDAVLGRVFVVTEASDVEFDDDGAYLAGASTLLDTAKFGDIMFYMPRGMVLWCFNEARNDHSAGEYNASGWAAVGLGDYDYAWSKTLHSLLLNNTIGTGEAFGGNITSLATSRYLAPKKLVPLYFESRGCHFDSGGKYAISTLDAITVRIIPGYGHTMPYDEDVEVYGASYSYDRDAGEIVISNVNSAGEEDGVNICAWAPQVFPITVSVTNGSYTGDTTVTDSGAPGSESIVTIIPDEGYILPKSVTIAGATVNYFYDSETGSVILYYASSPVTITAECISSLPALNVTGLGNEDPNTVVFTESGSPFDWDFEEVTVNGNVFIKIPTMYRKINTITDGQITSFSLSNVKVDDNYYPYPCFIDYGDNNNVLPYVLIGKYCSSSDETMNSVNTDPIYQTITDARTNARALGAGYQLYDWQFQKLFVDLAMCHKKTVNFNSGQTINKYLGIAHLDKNILVDGFYHNNDIWYAALDPSDYVSNPDTHPPTGYTTISFGCPTGTGGESVKTLGYDANNPFFNQPSELAPTTKFTTYYGDEFLGGKSSSPVVSFVGYKSAQYGLWYSYASFSWSIRPCARLCYKPVKKS